MILVATVFYPLVLHITVTYTGCHFVIGLDLTTYPKTPYKKPSSQAVSSYGHLLALLVECPDLIPGGKCGAYPH